MIKNRLFLNKRMPSIIKNKLSFFGSLSQEEGDFLRSLVREAASSGMPMVEIGTLFGFTTQLMALDKAPAQKLITVDNFCWNPVGFTAEQHRHFTQRILTYCCEKCNVEMFCGDSSDFHKHYQHAAPSLVFIDAGHSYKDVIADINWARSVKAQIICGHDYSSNHPEVQQAVREAFGEQFRVGKGSVWAWKA